MMTPHARLLALGLVLGCGSSTRAVTAGPEDASERALALGTASITGAGLATHIATLASDAYEGRFPGSAGETKTVAYVAAALARLGVEPAPGGYLQAVPLVSTIVAPGAELRLDGGGLAVAWAWGPDFLAATARSEPVALDDVEIVFAGYGIEAPEARWNDYANVDVAGKLVIVLGGDPGMTTGSPALFEGKAMSYHGTTMAKKAAAARHGAAALLVLRADGEAGVPWDTLAMGARAAKLDLAQPGEVVPVAGILREDRAAVLFGGAAGLDRVKLDAARAGFRARTLPQRARLRIAAMRSPVTSHNVVGWLPGSERPDEYIIYVAHWDHVGVRPDLAGDRIFNGAVDNATGTAALLELAEAYAKLPARPRRSIVFLATTAEEQGLLGSRHYVNAPLFPLAGTVGVINMDALFPFGRTGGMTVVALGASELDGYLAAAARAVGRTLQADGNPEAGAFFRSDHYPFAEKGVPALFAVGNPSEAPTETVKEQDFIEYVTRRYHQPADEFDPRTWKMEGIVQDVVTFFRAGYALAQSDAFPTWRDGHPFRRLRDEMRPAR